MVEKTGVLCYTKIRKVGVSYMSKETTPAQSAHRTSIGGQAVMEGVMMRGPHRIATAVRKPDGDIVVDQQELGKIWSLGKKKC